MAVSSFSTFILDSKFGLFQSFLRLPTPTPLPTSSHRQIVWEIFCDRRYETDVKMVTSGGGGESIC